MRIDPAAAAAQRTVGEATFSFCSPHCAATFDADPNRYTAATTSVAAQRLGHE